MPVLPSLTWLLASAIALYTIDIELVRPSTEKSALYPRAVLLDLVAFTPPEIPPIKVL